MLSFRHARKHFSQAEGSQLDEVRQVMGMLAFPPDTHISPYKVTGACGPSGLMGLSVATSTLSVTSTPSRPFPILICFAGKKFGSEKYTKCFRSESPGPQLQGLPASLPCPCSACSCQWCSLPELLVIVLPVPTPGLLGLSCALRGPRSCTCWSP